MGGRVRHRSPKLLREPQRRNQRTRDTFRSQPEETSARLARNTCMTQSSPEFLDFQAALAGEYSLQRELGRGGMGSASAIRRR